MTTRPTGQQPLLPQDKDTAKTQSIFKAVNVFLGAPVTWLPIEGTGTTNALFRTHLPGQPLVLRLSADDTQAFGVNRQSEADVLTLIQGYDWAPRVLHNDWQAGWCLMSDHGISPKPQESRSYTPLLLQAVRQWQQIITGPCFDYPALYQRYRDLFAGQKNSVWIALLERLESINQALPEVPECLTHHDLHRGNLCLDDGRLVVLDWEYAGIGNPWFDAAALNRQFGISVEDIANLPAWQALSPTDFKTGLILSLWHTEALENLWYAARERGTDIDSDRISQAKRLLDYSLPFPEP
ncbi:phosphotransferase [Amphritea sp. HPY]|uniref:phosphotransferase n=1 Tax=Amphritea sp. HPY TaxID=3421652 RepID=UPI003D7E69FC